MSLLSNLWMISWFRAMPDIIAVEAATWLCSCLSVIFSTGKIAREILGEKFTDIVNHCGILSLFKSMSDRPTPYNSKNQNLETRGLSPLSEVSYEQGSLFSEGIQRNSRLYDSGANYEMGSQSLQVWKQAIAKYQSSITAMIPAVQTALFDLPSSHCDPHAINPFTLPIQPAEFYRLPSHGSDDACIYFVIDLTSAVQSPVLLYVGETCRSHKRWKGLHDCKRYLLNYRELHTTHNLPTQVVMTFWWDAPLATRPRQQLERILIDKWRSPFNKENWNFWGTPFVN